MKLNNHMAHSHNRGHIENLCVIYVPMCLCVYMVQKFTIPYSRLSLPKPRR